MAAFLGKPRWNQYKVFQRPAEDYWGDTSIRSAHFEALYFFCFSNLQLPATLAAGEKTALKGSRSLHAVLLRSTNGRIGKSVPFARTKVRNYRDNLVNFYCKWKLFPIISSVQEGGKAKSKKHGREGRTKQAKGKPTRREVELLEFSPRYDK